MAELLEEVTASLRRMADATAKHNERVRQWLGSEPESWTCPHGERHPVDFDATALRSWQTGKLLAIYSPCEKCKAKGVSDRAAARLGDMGVPALLLHATLDNWKARTLADKDALEKVRRFGERQRGTLVLRGGVGLGKSHLAVGVLRKSKGRFLTQGAFLLTLRARYSDPKVESIVDACKATPTLVLDELGVSGGGRDEFPALYEVFNHRYSNGLPTVFTTNLTDEEILEGFGERFFDRFGEATLVELAGKSYRGRQ